MSAGQRTNNNAATTGTTDEQRGATALLRGTAAAAEAGRGGAGTRGQRRRWAGGGSGGGSGGRSGGGVSERCSKRARSCLHCNAHTTVCQGVVRYFPKRYSDVTTWRRRAAEGIGRRTNRLRHPASVGPCTARPLRRSHSISAFLVMSCALRPLRGRQRFVKYMPVNRLHHRGRGGPRGPGTAHVVPTLFLRCLTTCAGHVWARARSPGGLAV